MRLDGQKTSNGNGKLLLRPNREDKCYTKNKRWVKSECALPVTCKSMQHIHERSRQGRPTTRVLIKCRKMYKYIFWFLFDMVITNSYILYKNHRQASQPSKTMPLKQFRLQLADLLIGDYCSRNRPGQPYAVTKKPVPLLHMPMKRFDEEEDRRTKRSKCILRARNSERPTANFRSFL